MGRSHSAVAPTEVRGAGPADVSQIRVVRKASTQGRTSMMSFRCVARVFALLGNILVVMFNGFFGHF